MYLNSKSYFSKNFKKLFAKQIILNKLKLYLFIKQTTLQIIFFLFFIKLFFNLLKINREQYLIVQKLRNCFVKLKKYIINYNIK